MLVCKALPGIVPETGEVYTGVLQVSVLVPQLCVNLGDDVEVACLVMDEKAKNN